LYAEARQKLYIRFSHQTGESLYTFSLSSATSLVS